MSKISHLLEMIITLQYKGLTTASELADTLGVDKKTIYRYINSLNEANIPIHTKKGRYGGFYIDKEFYMKPSKLNEEELQSLLMASHVLTEENGFVGEKSLKTAIEKIKSLCINEDNQLKYLNDSGSFNANEIGSLQSLEDKIAKINYAMSRGRTLSLNYLSLNKNNLTIEKLDCYNLIFREGAWHAIGYNHRKDSVQTFRVSRISSLKITDEIYMRPYNFSLKDYIRDNWGSFKEGKIKVTIKFSEEAVPLIKSGKWHISEELEILEDGSVLFNLYVDETGELKNWVIGFGRNAELIEPQQLREEIKQELAEMCKKY